MCCPIGSDVIGNALAFEVGKEDRREVWVA